MVRYYQGPAGTILKQRGTVNTDSPAKVDASDASADRRPCRFLRRMRVLRRTDFERALNDGLRATDKRITLWAAPNGLSHPRLGLVVGRKHGNAVRRNRIKRVLREAFRLAQHDLPPGFDLVCSPRPGGDIELAGCMESLARLATRLARRFEKR